MNKKIFLILLFVLSLPLTQVSADTFNSPGSTTWTVPIDAARVRIEVWGGGGSGGAGYKTKNHHVSGFGGGAGGYASREVVVTPGDVLQVTVGNPGTSGAGGSNSEVTKSGVVIVGAGGGGAGMSGSTPGGSGTGAGAGAGGTNISYAQKGDLVNDYDNKYPRGRDTDVLLNVTPLENTFSLITKLFSVSKVFAQETTPPEPTFDVNYVGVAGQGGRGYVGDVMMNGSDGGPYSKVGGNPYASSGGSSPSGGAGGLRGRLGRDGSGHGSVADVWAKDGATPGAGGGGSDTGMGGWGASGKVIITVIENQPLAVSDVCPNLDGDQSSIPTGKVFDSLGSCVDPISPFDTDMCLNYFGMQLTIPLGYDRDNAGNCYPHVNPNGGVTVSGDRFAPKGWIDNVSCTALSGWAYDPDLPNGLIDVHLYDGPASDGKILTSVSTIMPRPDVNTVEGIVGNHGYSYVTPSALKDDTDHFIYAYGINSNGIGPHTLLAGSPSVIRCAVPPKVNPSVITPAVTVSANPATIIGSGTTNISWVSANVNSSTNICSTSWSVGQKASVGSEVSSIISNTTTFIVTCTSVSGGVGTGSITVPVTSSPIVPTAGNGISYTSIPSSVVTGASFTISVMNTGTKPWTNHDLAIKSGGAPIQLVSLNGTAVGGSKTVTMGGISNAGAYTVEAVEQGVEYFGGERNLSVTAVVVTDVCPNIPGVQVSVPAGQTIDSSGRCVDIVVAGGDCSTVIAVSSINTTPGFPAINGASGGYSKGSTATIQWSSPSYTGFFAEEREPITCSGNNISPDTHMYRNINTTIPNISESSSVSGSCSNSKGSSSIVVTFRCPLPPSGGGGGGTTCTGGKVPSGATCVCPASTIEVGGMCAAPDFSLSATPSTVKVKSIAGYSGATELAVNLSVNPVPGFDGGVTISISSDLDPYGPEFSINNGPYTSSHTLGALNQGGSLAFLPVKIRFTNKLPKGVIEASFTGTGRDSHSASSITRSIRVKFDSSPLYPGYIEI